MSNELLDVVDELDCIVDRAGAGKSTHPAYATAPYISWFSTTAANYFCKNARC
ncbi:hypothetical protein [Methylomonas koyamae]|uniref:hypothetical protein n=1 Tax=Methylomonas koyamae TaxID=702114 RepID=UPI000A971C67|nr:hypothetical protein [Methylomonas koyamae]